MRTPVFSTKQPHSHSVGGMHVASLLLLGPGNWAYGLVWMAVGLFLSMALAGTVQAQLGGVLEGQVVNGTAGGADLGEGLPVVLHVYRSDIEVETQETETDADGRFRFEGLDTDAGLEYWPEVVYLDVSYSSIEAYRFEDERMELAATITVYEVTDDDNAVRLDSVHIIAESFGEVLRISEVHLFGNAGDRTYIGGGGDTDQGATVFIPLPANAVGLAFGEDVTGDRFVEVEGGLIDTMPVPPGAETSLVFFSYHLIVADASIPLERRFDYPVTNLNMLVAQPGLRVSSEQLLSMGSEAFQGRQYEFYVAQNPGPDTPLVVEFVPVPSADGVGAEEMVSTSDQPVAGASARGNQRLLLWIGFGLAALAVLGAVIYPLATQRLASTPGSTQDLASNPKARRLLAELADLEETFEAGQIDEASYERQRAELYEELRSR